MEQAHDNKRLAKNTLLLYVRMLFLMCISLYTSRIILNALGVEDYGIYNAVGGFVSLFSLISASLTVSISRFITFELGKGNRDKLKRIFTTSINVEIILCIIIALFGETIGLWFLQEKMVIPEERRIAALIVYQLSLVTLFIDLVSIPYNAAIIAYERMSAFAYISIIEALWKLCVCYILLVVPFDKLVVYGIFICMIAIFVRLLYGWYCKQHFSECKYQMIIDKQILKQIFEFAGWETIGSSAFVLRGQGANLMINLFSGPTVNAARGVALQASTAINGFVSNFNIALNPQITKTYAQNDKDYFMNLIIKGARFSFYLMMIISLPFILNTHYVLQLWLKIVPDHSVWFLRLVLLSALIDTLSGTMRTAQNATGNNKLYQICIGGTNLFSAPLYYIFLKMGAIPEIVFIIDIGMNIFHLFIRIPVLGKMIPYFDWKLFTTEVLGNSLLVFAVAIILPVITYIYLDEGFLSFFWISSVSLLSSLLSVLFIGCNSTERTWLFERIRKITRK